MLLVIGYVFVLSSFVLFVFIFFPVATVEINYNLRKPTANISRITPVDKNFGIIIPKIGANAKIMPQVDPYNSYIYQVALTKGVAQARGTSLPNEAGNMFLFSHSSANILDAAKYNSVFYLLSKLKKGDSVYIYFKNVRYKYVITGTKLVNATDVSYLNQKSDTKTLTLMTCWPPGTTLNRLLVLATISK